MSKKFLDPQVYFFELATTNKTPVVYPRTKMRQRRYIGTIEISKCIKVHKLR
jgi:hypothetical protein